MTNIVKGAVIALCAAIPLSVVAEPTRMSDEQLDRVVAGWAGLPEIPNCGRLYDCGNNGWGNGPDSTNPGSGTMESPRGYTTISKATNGAETDFTRPNMNPVDHSTGR